MFCNSLFEEPSSGRKRAVNAANLPTTTMASRDEQRRVLIVNAPAQNRMEPVESPDARGVRCSSRNLAAAPARTLYYKLELLQEMRGTPARAAIRRGIANRASSKWATTPARRQAKRLQPRVVSGNFNLPLAARASLGHIRRTGDVAEWLKAAVC